MMNTNGIWLLLCVETLVMLVTVRAFNTPPCPMDMPECCHNDTANPVPAGTVMSNPAYECYTNTCKHGQFVGGYHCPPGFVGIGVGCYHVGLSNGTWFEGRDYCQEIGGHLAIIDTEEEAVALQGHIDPNLPTGSGDGSKGLVWLGASYQNSSGLVWLNNLPIDNGYTNFAFESAGYSLWDCLTAFCKDNNATCYHWFQGYCNDSYQPLCEADCKEVYCYYKGKSYPVHAVMARDPDCECSWIECGEYGEPIARETAKPCCTYRDVVYGNGETVDYSRCFEIICEEGQLVSYPNCTTGFTLFTYAGASSCYHFSDHLMSFHEAEVYCEMKDSKLIEISSEEENEALEEHLLKHQDSTGINEYWLNAEAQLCQGDRLGKLRWMGDLFDIPVEAVYNDFCDGQPGNSSSSRCLSMVYVGAPDDGNYCWGNQQCSLLKRAICEKCSKCEHYHVSVCYHDNKIFKEGEALSHRPIHNGQCLKTFCRNGRVKEIIEPC